MEVEPAYDSGMTTPGLTIQKDFEKMGLKKNLVLSMVVGLGWSKASRVQSMTIPAMLAYKDLYFQGQTGTGKTSAFCVCAVNSVNVFAGSPLQAIIVSPTRELAQQTQGLLSILGGMCDVKSAYAIGGMSPEDKKGLENRLSRVPKAAIYTDAASRAHNLSCIHILSGTPGRLRDLIDAKIANVSNVCLIVLDEADSLMEKSAEMRNDVLSIVHSCPRGVEDRAQLVVTASTFNANVRKHLRPLMRPPGKFYAQILIDRDELSLSNICAKFISVKDDKERLDVFCDIAINGFFRADRVLVFCNSKQSVEKVYAALKENSGGDSGDTWCVLRIHSERTQSQREDVLKQFVANDLKLKILITTDLLSHGFDIQDGTMSVINYEFPFANQRENYLHRMGRTGRFGKRGYVYNLVNKEETIRMRDIEQTGHMVPAAELAQADVFGSVEDGLEPFGVGSETLQAFERKMGRASASTF